MIREAIEHALAGEQIEQVTRLIEQHGSAEPVIARLEELPETWAKKGREARALDARVLRALDHVREQGQPHGNHLAVLGQPGHRLVEELFLVPGQPAEVVRLIERLAG